MWVNYGRHVIEEDDIQAVLDVLKSDFLTQGPKVEEFEAALCAYTGAKYSVCVSNGTAALHIAAMVAGLRKDTEAIVPTISFVATANCAVFCGAKPIFCDVLAETINIDVSQIDRKAGLKTKAVIPVHFAGQCADMQEIFEVAKKKNFIVIEDASHALGAEYRGHKVGDCFYSDMTVFSFHPVKSITTAEGGAVLTNDKALYEHLRLLRNHGITRDPACFIGKMEKDIGPWYYEMQQLGYNYRITDLQCALGISQLRKLDDFIARRNEIARIYDQELEGVSEIRCPVRTVDRKSSYHLYQIILDGDVDRKKVFCGLQDKGIGVQVHYKPIHTQPFYRKEFGCKEGSAPLAEDYYRRCLSLPIYPTLNHSDVRKIANLVKEEIQLCFKK